MLTSAPMKQETVASRAASGEYRYEAVDGFFKRPRKWTFVEVADVDVDIDDNVYVFTRSPHPVMIFDKQGKFLDAWGETSEHFFTSPHGLSVGPDGSIYTADNGDHTVRKWTKDGHLLMTLGRVHVNTPAYSGKPFHRPTHFTVASNGDLYVSDGYGNAHIHCFDASGQLKFSWGERGDGPGQFDTIHSVFVDREEGDTVYAADRYNNRVQFFTREGKFLGQWQNLVLPTSVRKGRDGMFYIAELHHRITVCTADGTVLARWGEDVEVDDEETGGGRGLALPTAPARNPMLKGKVINEPGAGLFGSPHGIAVDSEGSIYVADVSESVSGLDRGSRSIQKLVRV
jgi:DNA-binding beta-propeller fold protein YncE